MSLWTKAGATTMTTDASWTAVLRLMVASTFPKPSTAPLTLMPPVIQTLAGYLPFQLTLYFPIELILGRMAPADIQRNFALAGVWLLYLREPARLNTADPLSYRVLADSLMSEDFWRLVLSEDAQSG